MALVLAISLAVLLLVNLLGIGYAYYRYVYKPKRKFETQIARGRVPDQFLPTELQQEEEAAVAIEGRIYARKPDPLKWQERQTAIGEHFSKHPELRAAWEEKRGKYPLLHDAGMGA